MTVDHLISARTQLEALKTDLVSANPDLEKCGRSLAKLKVNHMNMMKGGGAMPLSFSWTFFLFFFHY